MKLSKPLLSFMATILNITLRRSKPDNPIATVMDRLQAPDRHNGPPYNSIYDIEATLVPWRAYDQDESDITRRARFTKQEREHVVEVLNGLFEDGDFDSNRSYHKLLLERLHWFCEYLRSVPMNRDLSQDALEHDMFADIIDDSSKFPEEQKREWKSLANHFETMDPPWYMEERQTPDHDEFRQGGHLYGLTFLRMSRRWTQNTVFVKEADCNKPGHNGLIPGQWFYHRAQICFHGGHSHYMLGVQATKQDGAYAVVVVPDDQYESLNVDNGDTIEYAGTGADKAVSSTEVPDNPQVRALRKSSELKNPIRVFRKETRKPQKNIHAPEFGYRYDGLYYVDGDATIADGKSGKYERFTLKRLTEYEGQPRPSLDECKSKVPVQEQQRLVDIAENIKKSTPKREKKPGTRREQKDKGMKNA